MQNIMGTVKRILPPHMVPSQLKILIPVGTPIAMVEAVKKALAVGRHADGEHVVRPHAQAEEADGERGRHHDGVAENRLAREHRNDLGDEGEAGNDQDVHFGMAEDPEEVHPDDGRAAGLGVEEVAAQVAIDQQHDLRRRQRRDDDQDQARNHQVQPGKQRHAPQRHARTAHAENGGDDIRPRSRCCRCR